MEYNEYRDEIIFWRDYYDDDISASYRQRLDKLDRWFTTKAVYTSTHDMISKVLQ